MRQNRIVSAIVPSLLILVCAGLHTRALAAGGKTAEYFPPPESQGGWRMLRNADEVRSAGGMDPRKLEELKEWLLKSDNRDFAAVVIRHGQIVLQVERGNSASKDARRVASVSKAICATVLSIASERSQHGLTPRKMSFDDHAFDFIPWAQPLSDPRKAQITVKQLLNHTSGICPEAVGAKNEGTWQYVLGHTTDPKTVKLAFDPGTACGYSTLALHHASLVCETVTGKPYDQFAIEALLKPIGCERWSFEFFKGDATHGRHPSHGIGLPARDLARIGYCMLHEGRWMDRQVIPKWFVDQTAAPTHTVTTPEMRFNINAQVFSHGWQIPALLGDKGERRGTGIPRDARYKPGSGGQLIAFVPSLDLVVARQTGSSGQWQYEEYLRRACAAVLQNHNKRAFPKVSELPSHKELPDPLMMLDGRRVTTREQWMNERRPELMELFQHYMYGTLPPPPATVSGKLEREDRNAFNGKATLKEVTLTFGPPELPPIHLMLVVPNQRKNPVPVVLALNYFGNHTLVLDPKVRLSTNWMPERGEGVVNNHSTEASRGTWADIWRIEDVIDRGYALATFYNGDIDPDQPDERGIQQFFRQKDAADDCGTIGAWAWGLQRAVDYLVTDRDVDAHRIVVTGHSRTGKAALVAAAFDERIAMAIPHQAGSGGSAPSRVDVRPWQIADPATLKYPAKAPETVTKINEKFPHWFNARFKEFNDHPDLLPFDQHCLVALCAPRPVLFTNGRTDTWINPAGQFEVLRAAAPVYRLLGAGDFSATEIPPDGGLIDGTLGYFIRPGGHSLTPLDWKTFLDFADKHLGASSTPPAAVSQVAVMETRRWEMHEFELHGPSTVPNPFRDAALQGEFIAPSGKTHRIAGFYDGGDTWRLRFAPDEEGEWRYRLRGEGVEIAQEGRMKCVAPHGHGFIRIHPDNPYAFAYADGAPFFPMGDTCYGLYDDSPITPELRRKYLETRRRQHFNFVRMTLGHSKARAAAEPATYWAWGGTPDKPDLDRFNPAFFAGLDELFRDLQSRGMNIELILLNFYRPPFTNTSLWTPDREKLWLRYVIARYGAFPNVFLWTLANEYETHPDGRYRLDQDDVAWAKTTAQFVKQCDPYRHPVTVHPVISSSARGVSPREPFDLPWRIGGFFGEGNEIDVLSQQTGQHGEGTTWDERLQCWTGDTTGLVASVQADRRFNKPVLNSENGYEYLSGDPTSKKQVHYTDKVRHSSWRIVCAGGYFAAGFHGTIGHSDLWNKIDSQNHYTFSVRDEGAADQLRILYDFFTALPFWRMQPFEGVTGDAAVALAEPGKEYVVYLPQGGAVHMDLTAAKEPLEANWFNPRNGQADEPFAATNDKSTRFQAPDAEDWVLYLHSTSK